MTGRSRSNGLPEFCAAPTLFVVVIVAELVALVVVLAPEATPRPWLPRLGLVSVYVQWLAIVNAVTLCLVRTLLQNVDTRVGFVFAWVLCVAVTALASTLVWHVDGLLGLRLGVPGGSAWRFIIDNAAICALIAAALLRYLFVIEQWRMRVNAVAKAQVDALQARIRPHFLFNSMNTIASLIRTRPAEAEQTVEDLADLFRAALGADDRNATLGDELELVDHYLRIEGLRLGDRLVVTRDVDALPRDFAMPRLLLQPLIENAIYHGIQQRADGGTLALSGRRIGAGIEIAVTNPLAPDAAVKRNGVALANIRARIAYHFGERADLTIGTEAGQFRACMTLPGPALR